jgi:hypothetical protein
LLQVEYDKLYDFIKTITGAGKIMYDGMVKANEYTVTKMISRIRSGASSSDDKAAHTTQTG